MKTTHGIVILLIALFAGLLISACNSQARAAAPGVIETPAAAKPAAPVGQLLPAATEPAGAAQAPANPELTVIEFTLRTLVKKGNLLYIGVGGEIDGVINPDLVVPPGAVVHLILLNGDGMQHDLFLPDFDARTAFVSKIGQSAEITFDTGDKQPGAYAYYCTVPGHRQAGQEGKFIVAAP